MKNLIDSGFQGIVMFLHSIIVWIDVFVIASFREAVTKTKGRIIVSLVRPVEALFQDLFLSWRSVAWYFN